MASFAQRASKRDAKGKGRATTSNPVLEATTRLSAQLAQVGVLLGMAHKTSISHVVVGGVATEGPQTKRRRVTHSQSMLSAFFYFAFTQFSLALLILDLCFQVTLPMVGFSHLRRWYLYPPSFIRMRLGLVLFVKAHEDLIANGIIIQLNKF
jgi:hypothetical protein